MDERIPIVKSKVPVHLKVSPQDTEVGIYPYAVFCKGKFAKGGSDPEIIIENGE